MEEETKWKMKEIAVKILSSIDIFLHLVDTKLPDPQIFRHLVWS